MDLGATFLRLLVLTSQFLFGIKLTLPGSRIWNVYDNITFDQCISFDSPLTILKFKCFRYFCHSIVSEFDKKQTMFAGKLGPNLPLYQEEFEKNLYIFMQTRLL